jgi:phage/plasmid-like protein (TIGR03299 family)
MTDAVTIRKNGQAEHAFVGQVGWHGLGNQLKENAKLETWLKAAGMDWDIARAAMMFQPKDSGDPVEIDGREILYREDTLAPLGEVSKNYKVVQPREVLEFFRDLCDNNGFQLNTAGTLFGGKRFWALASVGDEAVVMGDDVIKAYLLLATSADGSLATTAQFTSIRVVCNNTLSWAVAEGKKRKNGRVSVSHRSVFKPDDVKDDLGIVRNQFQDFMTAARTLAKQKLDLKGGADAFVAKLLVDSKTIASKEPASTKAYKKIMELFQGQGQGADMKGAKGTLWGLVNSVTEYVDHHQNTEKLENRMNDAFFGRGDALKRLAMDMAMEYAK